MPRPSCVVCGQRQHGHLHVTGDHDYTPPPAERKKPKPLGLSTKPHRVQRRQEGLQAMQEHREAVRYCQAREYGLDTPCGVGPIEGKIDQQHIIARGAGGGKDYGKLASLCHAHHMWIEGNRKVARELGLNERAPVPEKVVERPRIRSRHE